MPRPDDAAPWDHDIPSVCPVCRAHHEAMANTMDDRAPTDGDVNLCIVCHGISVYDSKVPTKLRFPTDEELVEIKADPHIAKVLRAMKITEIMIGKPRGDYFPDP